MDQALIDQIVKKTVDRLLEKLIAAAPSQRVLMLFSGAGTGYVVGMQAIEWLAKGGHPLTVVMTASARHVIGEENVRKAGAAKLVGDDEWVNTPKLVREVDLVLLPTLSMNTAAHLALGLMDSLIATLTLGSLMAGKPVLAICDGANPYGNGGKVFADRDDTAPVLRAKMADNLTALMGYGIQLVQEDEFLFGVVRNLDSASPVSQPEQIPAQPKNGSSNNHRVAAVVPVHGTAANVFTTRPGQVLTFGDMTAYPDGSTLHLAAGTRLTPLAQEAIFRQGIHVVYE
jgi:hypothetical protein